MRLPFWLGRHVACSVFAGGWISTCNAVNFGPAVTGWLLIFGIWSLVVWNRRGAKAACAALLVPLAGVSGCVGLAIVAPVKTRDQVLARQVVLPRASMTLREVRENFLSAEQPRFPLMISVDPDEAQGDQVIHWPARELSVREFVAAIEAQTNLRHHFGGCGNGSSILFGSNCYDLSFQRDKTPR